MKALEDGFLVVLSDVKSEHDRDYFSWLTTEHVQERLGIPGFLAVRVFRRPIRGRHRYFIWYRLKGADVVDSRAYLERLNNPTPWSTRIMPVLENFARGGGAVVRSVGSGFGDFMFAIALNGSLSDAAGAISNISAAPEIRSAHLLITDAKKSEIRTSERELRTNNNTFGGLLIAESQSELALKQAAAVVSPVPAHSNPNAIDGFYQEVFALSN